MGVVDHMEQLDLDRNIELLRQDTCTLEGYKIQAKTKERLSSLGVLTVALQGTAEKIAITLNVVLNSPCRDNYRLRNPRPDRNPFQSTSVESRINSNESLQISKLSSSSSAKFSQLRLAELQIHLIVCVNLFSLIRNRRLVNAATGTGKTIAYLAPIIHHLQNYDNRIQSSDGTYEFVRFSSLASLQVYEILQKLLHRFHWIVPGYVMGGENRSKEKARLRKATPGRLLDHLKNTSSFLYTNLRWIIFDEADRILELGFGKEIKEILDHLATLNEKVNHLAKISLEDPVMIGLDGKRTEPISKIESLGSSDSDEDNEYNEEKNHSKILDTQIGDYNVPTQLIQRYVKVPCGARIVVLLSILKYLSEREASQKIVVSSTCDAVDFHFSLLSEFQFSSYPQSETDVRQMFMGCKMFRLHGNMDQEDRRKTFQTFKTEKSALLFSTDVAARGLDFPKVRCIIQYDSPGEATEYVHRVGRTARLGERGESLLFLQPVEIDYLQDLAKHGVSLTEYPLLKVLDSFPLRGQTNDIKKFVAIDSHPWVVCLQKALEAFIMSKPKIDKLAKRGFCSWVRAYTAHRGELKRIFMIKKLHLGHVAKSFALKQQPSLVGKSYQKQQVKRKRFQKQSGVSKKRRKITNIFPPVHLTCNHTSWATEFIPSIAVYELRSTST
ncbi:DEAD-box ATP-dependent RNA helicase 17 isoform X1 [Senna tora]|uniref:ATP-dependent RNA helicase n=1 Tax=Senna tora TaxID=362788 RepID=A0A834X322_9FABA|nr:DEAD-box ATP-dependent RNA helicase 17 isoform X1 [Senna tora]